MNHPVRDPSNSHSQRLALDKLHDDEMLTIAFEERD